MARIKIDLPPTFHFVHRFTIRLAQINYGNHLGNEQILLMAHEARERFFNSLGLTEMDLGGAALIQSDAAIVYSSEGKFKDEIDVYLVIDDMSRVAFDVCYLFRNRTNGKELARAKVGLVCFDYSTKKVQAVPALFKDRVEVLERIPTA